MRPRTASKQSENIHHSKTNFHVDKSIDLHLVERFDSKEAVKEMANSRMLMGNNNRDPDSAKVFFEFPLLKRKR